jgi:hypothetical protein
MNTIPTPNTTATGLHPAANRLPATCTPPRLHDHHRPRHHIDPPEITPEAHAAREAARIEALTQLYASTADLPRYGGHHGTPHNPNPQTCKCEVCGDPYTAIIATSGRLRRTCSPGCHRTLAARTKRADKLAKRALAALAAPTTPPEHHGR